MQHVLDPDGDMILTLTNPDAPFAVWHEDDSTSSPESQDLSGQVSLDSNTERSNKRVKTSTPSPVTYRISSRHLSLASRRSRKMRHRWEPKKESDGHFHISVEDWDSQALLTVMNIIHLRHRQVPDDITLEMLSKIAVIGDYFEFHEAIEVSAKAWIGKLQRTLPKSYCRDLILWVWVCHVFHNEDILKTAITTAVRDCPGQIQGLGFPMLDQIIVPRRTRGEEQQQSNLSMESVHSEMTCKTTRRDALTSAGAAF
ncbi:hypothetical protein Hte_011355 [Hypoxylon texense]